MRTAQMDALDAWLRRHNGVVSRAALLEMGWSSGAARRLVDSHRLVPLWRGIYRSPHHDVGRPMVMTAVCVANPSAAIGFTTAGQEWGFRGMRDPRIHVLVPHGCSPALPGVEVHRCRRIDPVDLVARRADGIRLTSPPRTLFDASAILTEDSAASAIEQALAEDRCTIGTLMSTSRRLHHPNRPGARRFEAVLRSRATLRGLARSELERIVRAAIADAGLPSPILNMPFRLSTGERIVIDLAWPVYRVAAEVDHPFWHDRENEAARDKRRDRKLSAMGWSPTRVTKADVDAGLEDAVGDLRDLLLLRGWGSGAAA